MINQIQPSLSGRLLFQPKRQPKAPKTNTSAKATAKRADVIGEIFKTNAGKCMVLEYRDTNNVRVKFLQTGWIGWCSFGNLTKGRVKDPYHPTVFGIGYLGASTAQDAGGTKESYVTWANMLKRCYDPVTQDKQPTYKYVQVETVWHDYSVFEKWHDENRAQYPAERPLALDSDLIPVSKGTGKHYSPDTCLLIPPRLNIQISRLERKLFEIDAYLISDANFPTGMHYDQAAGFICVELERKKKRFRPYNLDSALSYLRSRRVQIFKDKALTQELPENVTRVIRNLKLSSSKSH